MPISTDLTFSDGDSLTVAWRMINEAWGYFCGAVQFDDWVSTSKLLQSQIKFDPIHGHNHGYALSNGALIDPLAIKADTFSNNEGRFLRYSYFADVPPSAVRNPAIVTGLVSVSVTTDCGDGWFSGRTQVVFNMEDYENGVSGTTTNDVSWLAGYPGTWRSGANWFAGFTVWELRAMSLSVAAVTGNTSGQQNTTVFLQKDTGTGYWWINVVSDVSNSATVHYMAVLERAE